MVNKYFTVEVKPHMDALTAGQHSAFSDGDILFDWAAFNVPRGACKLIGAHVEIRPKGNANVDPNIFPLELLFAKPKVQTGPATLGALNTAAANPPVIGTQTDMFLGHMAILTGDFADTDSLALASTAAPEGMVFEGEEVDTYDNFGYKKLYVGGIAGGAIDLTSLTRINAGDLDGPTFTVNGTDPRLHFAVGDTLYATASGSAQQVLNGTIESIADANTITMTSASVTLSDTDFFYNRYPIRIVLTFEK